MESFVRVRIEHVLSEAARTQAVKFLQFLYVHCVIFAKLLMHFESLRQVLLHYKTYNMIHFLSRLDIYW